MDHFDKIRPARLKTTDDRYVKVAHDEWWDTTGIDIVPESVVDAYMLENGVGIVVIDNVDPLPGEFPPEDEETPSPRFH